MFLCVCVCGVLFKTYILFLILSVTRLASALYYTSGTKFWVNEVLLKQEQEPIIAFICVHGTGKTNYTSVLSKEKLEKAHSGWLLPLRTLVTGVMAENQKDYDQLAQDTMCSLNPIVLVLFRCIELVEEKMKLAV